MNLGRFLATTAGLALFTAAVAASPATSVVALASVGLLGAFRVTNANSNCVEQQVPHTVVQFDTSYPHTQLPSDVISMSGCGITDQTLIGQNTSASGTNFYYYQDRGYSSNTQPQTHTRWLYKCTQLFNPVNFLYTGSDQSARAYYEKMSQVLWYCYNIRPTSSAVSTPTPTPSSTPTPSPSETPHHETTTIETTPQVTATDEEEFFDASSDYFPGATPELLIKPMANDGLKENPTDDPDLSYLTIGLGTAAGTFAVGIGVGAYAVMMCNKSHKKDSHTITAPIPYDI